MIQIIKNNIPITSTDRPELVDKYLSNGYEICEVIYNGGLYKPLWNGVDFIESATNDDLIEFNYTLAKENVFKFLNENKYEGKKFFDDMHIRITMELSAIERNILFPILEEIDNLLYPPLNKIKTGDFASALWIFCGQSDPLNQFVLAFYDEAFAFCQEYYNTKYPK